MSERPPSRPPLAFNRIIAPELVNTETTIDAFQATIPIAESLGGDAHLTVTLGDLLKLPVPVDAIAYPYSGDQFFIEDSLPDKIITAAGDQVLEEVRLKQITRNPDNPYATDVAYTSSPGNLDASRIRHIMHVVYGPEDDEENVGAIERAVTAALTTATAEGLQSIAFSLFSTSSVLPYRVSSAESLRRMIRATESFITAQPDTPTKDIRFVAFYQPTTGVLDGVEGSLGKL